MVLSAISGVVSQLRPGQSDFAAWSVSTPCLPAYILLARVSPRNSISTVPGALGVQDVGSLVYLALLAPSSCRDLEPRHWEPTLTGTILGVHKAR